MDVEVFNSQIQSVTSTSTTNNKFGHAKFAYCGLVLGSSHFSLLPKLPQKWHLILKWSKLTRKSSCFVILNLWHTMNNQRHKILVVFPLKKIERLFEGRKDDFLHKKHKLSVLNNYLHQFSRKCNFDYLEIIRIECARGGQVSRTSFNALIGNK